MEEINLLVTCPAAGRRTSHEPLCLLDLLVQCCLANQCPSHTGPANAHSITASRDVSCLQLPKPCLTALRTLATDTCLVAFCVTCMNLAQVTEPCICKNRPAVTATNSFASCIQAAFVNRTLMEPSHYLVASLPAAQRPIPEAATAGFRGRMQAHPHGGELPAT